MKQVIQNYRDGNLELADVPAPALKSDFVLVRNAASLISAGTEKNMLGMAKKNLIEKALERPDLVRQVIAKAKNEGIFEAYKQAMNRLDTPVPLGYSSAGIVIGIGDKIREFREGDRVACTGSGFASHAEIVSVPENLVVKLPDSVNFESASFAALGGIALQAVRLASPVLGERVLVIGLGLLGQISVQLLKAGGCHVFGIDIDAEKISMALQYGMERGAVIGKENIDMLLKEFAPDGFDSVLIMASAKSSEILETAATAAKEKGKIVATGLVGLTIPRDLFFHKELELIVSRAWGPGSLEDQLLQKKSEYPYSYVRWTAKRNLEEFVSLLSSGSVKVEHLITHKFPIEKASEAYQLILEQKEPYIGVLFTYSLEEKQDFKSSMFSKVILTQPRQAPELRTEKIQIGVIGGGLFSTVLLPVLKQFKNLRLKGIATTTGVHSKHAGKKYGFDYCSANYREILTDTDINLVMILTRHGQHAKLITESLMAGKHVYVEKPLAVNQEQLTSIAKAYKEKAQKKEGEITPILFVGFNRRFSPLARWLKNRLPKQTENFLFHYTINAGAVPRDHWVHDPEQGGGRIIGEVCHFIDLIQFFTDSLPDQVYAECLTSVGYLYSDNVVISLKMKNGSMGTILYSAGGDKSFPRERLEIFGSGTVGVIENFRKATFTNKGKTQSQKNLFGINWGYREELTALFSAVQAGQQPPVSFEEYAATTLATFAIENSIQKKIPVKVGM